MVARVLNIEIRGFSEENSVITGVLMLHAV